MPLTDHFLVEAWPPYFEGSFNFVSRLPGNMALITVMSTGGFKIRWNVLSLSFSESGKWPLGLSDFMITILSVIIVFSTLERHPRN